eukprot:COSAG04_NODE_1072_length_8449_cov_48.325350_6_plen_242_part_00
MLRAAWLGAALATAGAADGDQAPPLGNASLLLPLPRRALQAADERAVLLAFKASGADPDGLLSTWLDGTDPCGWDGVTCHADGDFAGTVSQVRRYNSAGLTGDIGLLGELANLEILRLYSTAVTGDIASFSGLANLHELYLDNTAMTGSIASLSGLANLQLLDLRDTAVTGDAAALGGMANLQYLWIEDSYIYGDTTAVTVWQFTFTPCADLGGCGAGTLVASPAGKASMQSSWLRSAPSD